jgi:hypothetical protein
VEVAPWQAAADGSAGPTRHARGSAAVARANLEKVLHVGVLTSDSEAMYTEQKSTGTASTDGVQLGILDAINVVLLHSEVSSEGQGHSYLVDLNGTKIGTNDQLGASPLCALNAVVFSLSCLTATGGNGALVGATQAAAQVAQVTPSGSQLNALNPVAAFTAAGTSGTGQAPAVTAPAVPATPAPVQGAETSRAAGSAAAPASTSRGAGSLPRTGTGAAALATLAAAIVMAGSAFRRFAGRLAAR